MKENGFENKNKADSLTEKDFNEFLSATGEEQWKILLAHAERNETNIRIKRSKKHEEE